MATTYLTKAANANANQKLFTFSAWVKTTTASFNGCILAFRESSTRYCRIFFEGGKFCIKQAYDGSTEADTKTSALYKDNHGWYHLVIAVDTAQSTNTNRIKMYVNGEQITSFSSSDFGSQNADLVTRTTCYIGQSGDGDNYFSGVMSHVHYIDGTAYAASTFGSTDSTTGEWKITTSPTLTMGTTGFTILKDGNTITDQSSNSNDFSLGGGTLTNTEDCPSNVFATLNGIHVGGGNSTLSNGNTTYSLSNYSYNTRSTLGMPSGKFYWEQKQSDTSTRIGLITSGFTIDLDTDNANAYYGGSGGGGVYLLLSNNSTSWQLTNNNTSRSVTTYTNAIASSANDILMGAVDVDAGKLWIGVNGTWFNSGNPATAATPTLTFTNSSGDDLQIYAGHGTDSARVSSFNFGNGYFGTTAISSEGTNASGIGKFEYDVPAGYTALSTKGLNE